VTDITALKNAEAEVVRINADLRRSNEQLARSNEDLERFAFVASHDLQEPLRMITTYLQLLVRTYPAQFEGEGNMFVRNIVDGAARMRSLLADLLSYSEIGGEPEDAAQTIDLNAVVETARQNLKMAVEESGAVIDCDELPDVTGHTIHFVQLFQNLIGNAIKYRGADPPRIHISCETADNCYRFAIADNGMGIDPAYHTKIFGVFKRLHGKKIPGTGIGLAICQRVVERYHGRIWVESESGRGATFFFTLNENTVETGAETNG
jgi:light-regulated signal transduction histidine kinase (bacteriophytochrome)